MKETTEVLVQDQVTLEAEGVIDPGLEETGAVIGFENESIAGNGSVVVGESFAGDELLDSEVGISTTEGFFVEMNKKGNRRPPTKKQIKERRKKSKRKRQKKKEQLQIERKAAKRTKKKTRPSRSY